MINQDHYKEITARYESYNPEPTRAERRAKQRQLKKKINNYKKRK